ncbi:TonB-dependent receptor [Kordiimonas pumila]|uniref:TonB-dependent receptor n=1 Tax=Kordiimonas pumila TaxID=2161677 RepID=A0ABV7D2W0_9PROT|nr:TonB-dependent receptor [Kordiimonas pumila]
MKKISYGHVSSKFMASVAVCAAALGAALPAHAQADTGKHFALEEIVVTAQKREATLKDTPIAVSAVGGSTMELAQLRDIRDLQVLVPSLQIAQRASASNTSYSIRGISSSTFNFGLEPAVGVFVDGVYRSRNGASVNDFLGIERIEVLRGPQSTLFGKNTTAGVVNIITKAPTYDTGVEGELTYGNYDAFVAKGAINLPITEDKLAVRLDMNWNQRDGVIDNYDGRELNERDRYGMRGQVLYEPSENTRVRLIADYNNLNEECCAAPFFEITPQTQPILSLLGSQITAVDLKSRTTFINGEARAKLTTYGFSGQIDHDFDSFTLTSITAYRDYDEYQNIDADFSDLNLNSHRILNQSYNTFTQEIRLASTTDKPVQWMVGAYYFKQDLQATNSTVQGAALRPFADLLTFDADVGLSAISQLEIGLGVPSGTFLANGSGQLAGIFDQTNETYAAFGQVDWHVSDDLTVTAGVRYTHDKKSMVSDITIDDPFAALDFVEIFVGQAVQAAAAQAAANGVPQDVIISTVIPQATAQASAVATNPDINPLLALGALQFFPPAPDVDGDISDSAITGNLIVSYDVSEKLNLYASYARGYKGGGFALDSAAARVGSFSFDNETVNAFELGVKARLMDNRMSLDFALYDQTINDFQENLFVGSSFIPGNAGKIKVRGLEFDGKFQATPELLLTAGFLWNFKAEYAEYLNGPCPVVAQENCTPVQAEGGTAIVLVQDLSGTRLSEAPKFSGNFTATYMKPIGHDLEMFLRGQLYYQGYASLASDADPRQFQDAYALVDASIGVGAEDGSWQLQFWGRNLFDKFYVIDTFNSTFPGGSLDAYVGDPRTYGLTLRFKY